MTVSTPGSIVIPRLLSKPELPVMYPYIYTFKELMDFLSSLLFLRIRILSSDDGGTLKIFIQKNKLSFSQ